MKRIRWLLLLLCCLVFPVALRADGIDLPIALGCGVGIFLPLLVFNATVEAPVMARFMGIKFSEIWGPWFMANFLSLFAGIPALVINTALGGWFLPAELGARFRAYPFFLVLFVLVFFAGTCLVEWLYAGRIAKKNGWTVGRGALAKGVLLANLVSYAVLGPVYFFLENPATDVREFAADARWSKQPGLWVAAVGANGHLTAALVGGQSNRVVVPHEVRDYVVSADLTQVLYRGTNDRLFLFTHGTNQLLPELGFQCRAAEMDFSPSGRRAAFVSWKTGQVRVFDSATGQFSGVVIPGKEDRCRLVWSSNEDILYVRHGEEDWEVVAAPVVSCRQVATPTNDFAGHYGRVGNRWNGADRYTVDQAGSLDLRIHWGWGAHMCVSNEKRLVMHLRSPDSGIQVEQAVFVEGTSEILVGVGDYVYVLDALSKKIGPVMAGKSFVALTKPFLKRLEL